MGSFLERTERGEKNERCEKPNKNHVENSQGIKRENEHLKGCQILEKGEEFIDHLKM